MTLTGHSTIVYYTYTRSLGARVREGQWIISWFMAVVRTGVHYGGDSLGIHLAKRLGTFLYIYDVEREREPTSRWKNLRTALCSLSIPFIYIRLCCPLCGATHTHSFCMEYVYTRERLMMHTQETTQQLTTPATFFTSHTPACLEYTPRIVAYLSLC